MALAHFHDVGEGELPVCVGKALVDPPDSLIRQGLAFLVAFLGGEEVDEGSGGDV